MTNYQAEMQMLKQRLIDQMDSLDEVEIHNAVESVFTLGEMQGRNYGREIEEDETT